MNINGSMQQVQTQTQMQKMDGTGGGQGKGGVNGMKDIMQNLDPQDRTALQEKLSTLDQDQRSEIKDQLKSIDPANMSSSDYLSSLMDVFNPSEESTNTTGEFEPIYA